MSELSIRAYSSSDSMAWDEFCAQSYNASFLHTRRFLSYHGDRFTDRSCVIESNGRIVGVFPAAVAPSDGQCVVSHPGATYGGLVHDGRVAGADVIEALLKLAEHYLERGFTTMRYKAVPHIYHLVPTQDDLYALFRLKALRDRCDLTCVIDLESDVAPSGRRVRGLRKAQKAGVTITNGLSQLSDFWSVLSHNLHRRHGVEPVHSIDEITLLAGLFPQIIRLVCARHEDTVVAGTLLFLGSRVHHAQYIAASETGYAVAALDAVFDDCIAHARGVAKYFDFGTSNEDEGRHLNAGLYGFKREFGGGGVAQEQYSLDLAAAVEAGAGRAK